MGWDVITDRSLSADPSLTDLAPPLVVNDSSNSPWNSSHTAARARATIQPTKRKKIFAVVHLCEASSKRTKYDIAFSFASDSSPSIAHGALVYQISPVTQGKTVWSTLSLLLSLSLLSTQFWVTLMTEGILELLRNPKSLVAVSGVNLSAVSLT
jgi:hypothetical protein